RLHGVAELLLRIEFALHDADELLNLLICDGTTKRALRQIRETFAHLLHVALLGRHVVIAQFLFLIAQDRPAPCDRIHDEKWIPRAALLIGQFDLPRNAPDFRADERRVAMPA